MPTGVAPHKRIADDPGVEVRAEMARAAAGDVEALEVSELELRRGGPSYTHETLAELRKAMPDTELVWVMGADAALGLDSWRSPERIIELARLAIARRERVDEEGLEEVLARLGVDGAATVEMPEIGISSSAVRERVREGRPIGHLVPEAVAEMIAERGLYGG